MDTQSKFSQTAEIMAKERSERNEAYIGNEIEEDKNSVSIPSININKAGARIPEESKTNEIAQHIPEVKIIGKEKEEKENKENEPEINFKKTTDKIANEKAEEKIAEEEKEVEETLLEKTEILRNIDPNKVVDFSFDDNFDYYFHDEIGTIAGFIKKCISSSK